MASANTAIGTYVSLYAVSGAAVTTGGKTALSLSTASSDVGVNYGGTKCSSATFKMAFTLGNITAVTLMFEVSTDGGTTWYFDHRYDTTLNHSGDDFMVVVKDFIGKETHVRPNITAVTGTNNSGSLTISGKVDGIYKIVN